MVDPALVAELASRHAEFLVRCTFPEPGSSLVCGVSGGADSMALLVLAVASGCEVTAVHVDHGLRAGSAAEAEPVRALARRLGARFRAESVVVGTGPNLEARARAARHEVLGLDAALGHTADDRAETLLVNLLRGAGPDGLGSIRAGHRHPILDLRRSETERVCAIEGIDPFIDPTNADMAFVRNRIRHEVLPLLADISNRDPVPILDRQATVLAEIADHLRVEARSIDVTDARALATAPIAIARVAVREWLRSEAIDAHPPDLATVDRVLDVAAGRVTATDVGGGLRVARTRGRLRLESSAGT